MALSMVLAQIALPLALGIVLSLLARLAGLSRHTGLLVAAGVLLLALFQEGIPPFPPISSKHKTTYLLVLLCIAAVSLRWLPASSRTAAGVLTTALAFIWLNARRLPAGIPVESILMSVGVIICVGVVLVCLDNRTGRRDDVFLWPVCLFIATFATGLVSLLSGYIGMGQLVGNLAAFFGGVLLIPFIRSALGLLPAADDFFRGFDWAAASCLAVLGIGLTSFATNLHPLALCLLLLTLLSPLVARRMPTVRHRLLQPFLFAAIAAVPAAGAIAAAFLNF